MPTAADVARSLELLAPILTGRVIQNVGVAAGSLDLCLFFVEPPSRELPALRIATGSAVRARLGLERIALSRAEWLDGDCARIADQVLAGARLDSMHAVPGERCARLAFVDPSGARIGLRVELFGARGNWFLVDASERILTLAERPKGKRSELGVGTRYSAPAAGRRPEAEACAHDPTTMQDAMEWFRDQATRFAEIDARILHASLHAELTRDLTREAKGLTGRVRGLLERQRAETGTARLRREAELLLAQPRTDKRGLASIEVSDWYDEGKPLEIQLDAKISIRENAERRFDRAKRLEAGAKHTQEQLDAARCKLAQVEELRAAVDAALAAEDGAALRNLATQVVKLARPRQARPRRERKPAPRRPYHEFRSIEGYPIWVGRGRTDNDKLTVQLARGNDIWLHVAGGHGGSHVVIRLDRGKTASLESLLDAGTLALWFSKARGRPVGDVLYTPRKHVRKPKGFPAGRVEVLRSKTLRVVLDRERLARLLDSGPKHGTQGPT